MINNSSIIVNGKKIEFSGNAVIKIKRDVDNTKKIDTDNPTRMIIEMEGDVGDIKCDNADFTINGNVNRVITKSGNVKCDDITGKVVCMSLEAKNIKGYVGSSGDVIVNTFIGNTNVGYVIDNFVPIKNKSKLKEGVDIFHKKYGVGKIKSIWGGYTSGNGSMSVEFNSEEHSKTLILDKVFSNGSISLLDNNNVYKEYDKEPA